MAEERLIRKYANRRLYDAQDSRHVTLDDLRKLIAAGDELAQVVEGHMAAVLRVIQATVGVFAYQTLFGHGGGAKPPRKPAGWALVADTSSGVCGAQ